jgi:uncharacterized protein (TIGR00369 family)
MIKGGCATLQVANFDQALTFYTDTLGLKLLVRFGDQWACLDAGDGLLLGLVPADEPRWGTSIGFCAQDDFEAEVDRLSREGVRFDGRVDDGPVKIAYFGDLDGNPLHLTDSPPNPTTGSANQRSNPNYRPFFEHLGLRWNTVDQDRATVELDLRDDLCGPAGILQGGITATLVDVAAASTAALSGASLVATTEMTVHYLAPGRVGPVRAIGELLRSGKRGFAVEVRVFDVGAEDRLMAVALAAFAPVAGNSLTS